MKALKGFLRKIFTSYDKMNRETAQAAVSTGFRSMLADM